MASKIDSVQPPQHGLKRVLSQGFGVAAVLGSMIGLGILRNPGEIATVVNDPWIYMALWVLGGAFVLASVGVAAELVGMTPRSGGVYVLIRRAFGPYPGFLIGWVDWLSFCAIIALKATVVVEYIDLLFPFDDGLRPVIAITITSLFAALQLRGVLLTARVQEVAAAGMAMIVVGFTLALLFGDSIAETENAIPLDSSLAGWGLVGAAVIFTYDGWLSASYFGGEIRGGGREVARSCIRGVVAVFILYVGLMAALAWSVPLSALVGEDLALATALGLAISPAAAMLVVMAAVLILLSQQNLHYMGGPRVLYALSADHLGVERAAEVGKRGNPVIAVLLTWGVTVGLIIVGGFEFLLHLCVLFFVVLYVALVAGVALLRRNRPEAERPFRAWGHPLTTTLCLAGWIVITLFQVVSAPETAVYAAIMIAVSLPAFLWLKRVRHLE
ncbi:MAG: APC family permease [Xanthomonadales bacterium]|nr:APC family permease [Xanthomonadales bacterium]